MFKSDIPVYFVDYEYIWEKLVEAIENIREDGNKETIWLYSSDYSDIQGMDVFSGFNDFFIPRIEKLDGVMMESRTKSPNIQSLLAASRVLESDHATSNPGYNSPQNIEIAYSLNPQKIIEQYEHATASLDQRIGNINTLLETGWKVGIRIQPIMPVD